jgi:hypothetical protein
MTSTKKAPTLHRGRETEIQKINKNKHGNDKQ